MSEKKTPKADDFIWLKEFDFDLPDDKDNWHITQTILSTILEEYRALRAESIQISSLMITIFQMGIAVVGVLFAAGAVAWGNSSLEVKNAAIHIFYFVIPFFVFFIGILWSGEAFRFKRVGDYIVIIETKVEVLLRKVYEKNHLPMAWMDVQGKIEDRLKIGKSEIELIKPLAWEQWLKAARQMSIKSTSGHLLIIYILRIVSWILIAFISFVIGVMLERSINRCQEILSYTTVLIQINSKCPILSQKGLIYLIFCIVVFSTLAYLLYPLITNTNPISVRYTNGRIISTHYKK